MAEPVKALDPALMSLVARLAMQCQQDALASRTPADVEYYEGYQCALDDVLKAAPLVAPAGVPEPQGWQPIETAPRDEEVFFWVVPKTPEEAFIDTSGKSIFGTHGPHWHRGRLKTWSSLSKATHWMPLPAPPDGRPSEAAVGRLPALDQSPQQEDPMWTRVIKSSLDELYAALGVTTHVEAIQTIRKLKEPDTAVTDFWRCRICGCLWRDNHDETVSLASAKQTSCVECERSTPTSCEPLTRMSASGRLPALDALHQDGIALMAAERQRQIAQEDWTPDHDDRHDDGELASAAIGYIQATWKKFRRPPANWPWDDAWWKPSPDPVRNLVKAGALIAAEIDRLRRAGLRADPAPRQVLEEKEDKAVSRVETGATLPLAGSTAKISNGDE